MIKYKNLVIVSIAILILTIITLIASERISQLSKEKAEKGFIDTNYKFVQELKNISNEINIICFDKKANPNNIIIDKIEKYNNCKSKWAITRFYDNEITIIFSDKFVKELNDWPLIEAVMVHEMVHVLMFKNGFYNEEHGPLFQKEFNKALQKYCKTNKISKPSYENVVAYNLLRMSNK